MDTRATFRDGKVAEGEADRSHPPSAMIKNEWSYTSTPIYFHGVYKGHLYVSSVVYNPEPRMKYFPIRPYYNYGAFVSEFLVAVFSQQEPHNDVHVYASSLS